MYSYSRILIDLVMGIGGGEGEGGVWDGTAAKGLCKYSGIIHMPSDY